jgi:rubrerythrin
MATRDFSELSEQEVLALAITLEEEDQRTYEDFAAGLRQTYPGSASIFSGMAAEENGHRHRLLDLYQTRFGDHVPLIRRHDVKGFVPRRSVWLDRPLGLDQVRKQAELMEAETRRFYTRAASLSEDTAIR